MSTHTLGDGALFANRYRLVRCLARGGMGAVYEVVHVGTNRRRALKVMHSHILHSEELRERFHREAKVAAEVESDFIVDVFDAGIDDDTEMPFLCMELLRGEELSRRLKRLGHIPAEDLALHLHQTALALDRMHEVGIVHRDLKPENLFIAEGKDGPPRIKVLDFGIAKVVADGVHSGPATLSVGTPLYMSPEQFKATGGLTAASDVYALGMIAYTCLVGAPYWDEESRVGNIFAFGAMVSRGPTEAASVRAQRRGVSLPPGFDEWFAAVTSVDPEGRFSPATAATRALADVLGSPIGPPLRAPSAPMLIPAAGAPIEPDADALTMVPVSPRAAPPAATAVPVAPRAPLRTEPTIDAATVVLVPPPVAANVAAAAPARAPVLSEVDTLTAIPALASSAPSPDEATARDTEILPGLLDDDEGQTLVYKQNPDAKAALLRKIELQRQARSAAAAQASPGEGTPPAAAARPAQAPVAVPAAQGPAPPSRIRPVISSTLTPSGAALPAPARRMAEPIFADAGVIDEPLPTPDRGAKWRVVVALGVAAVLGIFVTMVALSGGGPPNQIQPAAAASATVPGAPPATPPSPTPSSPTVGPATTADPAPAGSTGPQGPAPSGPRHPR